MYLLEADDDATETLRGDLAALGDSLLVVGGDGLWNVHVHVDDVGAAIEAGIRAGRPYRIAVTHFAEQVARQQAARAQGTRAVVALVPGAGLADLAARCGALVVESSDGRPARPPGTCCSRCSRRTPTRWWCCPTTGTPSRSPRPPPSTPAPAGCGSRSSRRGHRCRCSPRWPCTTPARRFDDDVVAMTAAARATRRGAVTHRGARGADLGRRVPARRRPGHGRGRRRGDRLRRRRRSRCRCSTGCSARAASWSPWSSGADADARPGRPAGRPPAPGPRRGRRAGARRGPAALPGAARGGVTRAARRPAPHRRRPARTAKALEEGLGLHTVGDLLRHFPRRYAVHGELTDLGVAARGRRRDGAGRGRRHPHVRDEEPEGLGARGDRHRRSRAAAADVLREEVRDGRVARAHALHRPAGAVRRQGQRVQPAAPADPPGLRARRRRGRRPHRRGHRGRRGGVVREPAHPGLPGDQEPPVVEARQGGRPSCWTRWASCPTRCRPTCCARRRPPVAVRGVPARPPARVDDADWHRALRPVRVRGGVRPAGRAGPAPRQGRRAARGAARARVPAGCSPRSTSGCRSS